MYTYNCLQEVNSQDLRLAFEKEVSLTKLPDV